MKVCFKLVDGCGSKFSGLSSFSTATSLRFWMGSHLSPPFVLETNKMLWQTCITLWFFNIAMGNGPFIDGLPIKNGDFPWPC